MRSVQSRQIRPHVQMRRNQTPQMRLDPEMRLVRGPRMRPYQSPPLTPDQSSQMRPIKGFKSSQTKDFKGDLLCPQSPAQCMWGPRPLESISQMQLVETLLQIEKQEGQLDRITLKPPTMIKEFFRISGMTLLPPLDPVQGAFCAWILNLDRWVSK